MNETQTTATREVIVLPEVTMKPALTQRDIETYHNTLTMTREEITTQYAGGILRGAIAAGWFVAPICDHVAAKHGKDERFLIDGVEIRDMPPYLVDYYSKHVQALFVEAYTVPKA